MLRLLIRLFALLFPPFRPSNTAGNEPAVGWFLFLERVYFTKKMYCMLLCINNLARNVCAELAVQRIA